VNGRGFLLVRRGGSLWGIANVAVAGLERRDDGAYRVAARDLREGGDGGASRLLVADEVLGVVPELPVWPSPVTGRFWPEPFRGLSVHGELPVVVVEPGSPPRILRPDGPDVSEGPEGEDVGETEGRD
jgi:hypothetical protein